MIAVIRMNNAWRPFANRQANRILAICCTLLGLGLVPLAFAQTVVDQTSVVQTPGPSANQSSSSNTTYELLHILNQLNEIKAELKLLRNTVEEMEFENQKSQRRQSDLFLDIDRRLTELESIPVADLKMASTLENRQQTLDTGSLATEAMQVLVVPDGSMLSDSTKTDSSGETETSTSIADTEKTIDQSSITNVVSLQEQDLYDQAIEQLKQSRYEEAIKGFQQLAESWPSSQLADNAYFWMSEALYLNREFEQALAGFKLITENYPDSDRLPDAMLKIGYVYYDVGEYTNAANTFRSVLERFPNHQVSVSAQTRLRRIEQSIQ